VRRQSHRALHMLDRFAELAVLVGDDAEQMLGLGQVRLCFEDTAADGFGLHQPSLCPAALGIAQRLTKRHKGGIGLPNDLVHGRFVITWPLERPRRTLTGAKRGQAEVASWFLTYAFSTA
jgi:hypothetical protein